MERQLTLGDLFKQLASIILIIVSVIAIVLGVRQTLQYSRDMRAKNVLMNSVKTYVEEELKYASDIRIAPTRPGEDYHTLKRKKGYLYKDNKRVLKKDEINCKVKKDSGQTASEYRRNRGCSL